MGVNLKLMEEKLAAQIIASVTSKTEEDKQLSLRALGKKIAELSDAKGLNQKQLAELMHISQPMISRVQNGKEQPPLDMIKRFAEVLGVRPGYLMDVYSGYDNGNSVEDIVSSLPEEIISILGNTNPEELKIALGFIDYLKANGIRLVAEEQQPSPQEEYAEHPPHSKNFKKAQQLVAEERAKYRAQQEALKKQQIDNGK